MAAQDLIEVDHGEAVSTADGPMDGSAISALRGFKSALRGLLAGLCFAPLVRGTQYPRGPSKLSLS